MRLAWATDIHLNFLSAEARDAFAAGVADAAPDAVVLTGDIAEAPSVEAHLLALEARLARPIYFVLGNHDCYRGSIAGVRAAAAALSARSRHLRWLPAAGVVPLAPGVALVGVDGWGDGRLGDYARSPVLLNDFFLIEELAWLDPAARLARLHALGDEAAAYARATLPGAMAGARAVVFATHVPPFREACWHEGAISDDDWLPHFTCEALGAALLDVAAAHPGCALTVLCGHTHGAGEARLAPNVVALTGAADYGAPTFRVLAV